MPRVRFIFILLAFLSAPRVLLAQPVTMPARLLAVLPFESTAELDRAARELLEDTVRTETGTVLQPLGFTVFDSANTLRLLADNGVDPNKVCETNCALGAAREMNAEFFITGKISRVEGDLYAFIRLTEVRAGRQLAYIDPKASTVAKLRSAIKERLPELLAPIRRPLARSTKSAEVASIPESSSTISDVPDETIVSFESAPPGAVVRLDETLLCQATPCKRAVTIGPHLVSMEKERYAAQSQAVIIEPKAPVKFALERLFGTILVQTEPAGLAIAVDGKSVTGGRADVDPGTHSVIIADRCYLSEVREITVQSGQDQELRIAARARVTKLRAYAVDADGNSLPGRVLIDAKEAGEIVQKIEVPLCSRRIEVVLNDGRTWGGPLKLEEGKLNDVHATLGGSLPNAAVRPVVSQREESASAGGIPKWAWWTGGAGLAVWAGAGLSAMHIHSELQSLPAGDPSIDGQMGTGRALTIISNVGAVALGVAVVGAIWHLQAGK